MATVFEGEKLLAVVKFDEVSGYTVPAGRYAKVTFQNITPGSAGSITIDGNTLYTQGASDSSEYNHSTTAANTRAITVNKFVLAAGQVIAGAIQFDAVALEFEAP